MRLWTTGERVAALKIYDILDTPPEAAFEDIVEIARALTGAPIALVSLLDGERQWFKARRGADIAETPLSTSFCMLAAEVDEDVLVIPDAAEDPRTAGMALVAEAPAVRSYAGVLLRSREGVPLGTVCVLDVKPRAFSDDTVSSLRALARQATAQLELRRAAAERQSSATTLRDANLGRELAMQAARLGRWDHHPGEGRRFYDPRAREILGLGETEDISLKTMLERIHPQDRDKVADALDAVLSPDRVGPYDVQFRIGPHASWVSAVGRTQFADGVCTRFFGVLEDVTERRRAEEHRAFLAAELNHRVKNILSLAQSVVDTTLRTAADLAEARTLVGGRLVALSRAHDLLMTDRSEAAPLGEVAEATLRAAGVADDRVALCGPVVQLGSRAALQLALALHELATNAAKHGALSAETGRVSLIWAVEDEAGAKRLRLSWTERGGPPVTPPARRGFGSRVIGRATEAAFGGAVELVYAPEGVRWSVAAPLAGLGPPEA